MSSFRRHLTAGFAEVLPKLLPFADAATKELPLGRLLRLSLFQVSVGMAVVLLNGTLNRVMILELSIPAWLVAAMVSLPLLFAPFRALVGFRSDTHKSALGWRRVPYIAMGSLLQFGGLAIMPVCLLVLSEPHPNAPPFAGEIGSAIAFLCVGVGLHTTQTAGLALATDLAPERSRPRVVALLYVMLLVGMVLSALAFGLLLRDFDQLKLIKVIQGAALLSLILNGLALWKQEALQPELTRHDLEHPSFSESWGRFVKGGRASRLLVTVGLGTAGFNMQDILLEPYAGEVFGMSVSATTTLTALLTAGTLLGFAWAARTLSQGGDAFRLSAMGALAGIAAFSMVVFADPLHSAGLFRLGTFFIGIGSGLFGVGTLTAAMSMAEQGGSGLALGAWGSVQATAMGAGIALGGAIRDTVSGLATAGSLGPGLTTTSVGYSTVYHLEIALLFATLIAVGPLVSYKNRDRKGSPTRFGLAELPG